MIFLEPQCDVKGCKKNLVIRGNFDNKMERCITKDIGLLNRFLWTDQNGLNKNGLKPGSRFCQEHHQDHHQIDKVGIK